MKPHTCFCDDGAVEITCFCAIGQNHNDHEFYEEANE